MITQSHIITHSVTTIEQNDHHNYRAKFVVEYIAEMLSQFPWNLHINRQPTKVYGFL